MNKKLIFCFDGTCNDPGDADDFVSNGSISNVLKLHAFLGGGLANDAIANASARGKDKKGVAGKGDTEKSDSALGVVATQHSHYYSGIGTHGNKLRQIINAMIAPADGDMEDILAAAFADLQACSAEPTAEIYIFGFSRGAALARIFAAQLAAAGRAVHFLGVFDTVAATRRSLDLNPSSYPASSVVFENGSIHANVREAVHLVAIDERRVAFQPTLFNHDKRVHEVWFAGAHSDVGGGYWYDGLSDLCLDYMMKRVGKRLTFLAVGDIDLERLKVPGAETQLCRDDLDIHPLSHGKMHSQQRSKQMSNITLASRRVRVNDNDLPTTDPGKLPIVHHSVAERFSKATDYRPFALRDVQYRVELANGRLSKPTLGISGLRKINQAK